MSEKLDGRRAFWDGGISRNIIKSEVPWANTDKDERLRNPEVATGLWSRYGNVIHAPNWWLDMLPKIPCDGELWIDKLKEMQQLLMSITSKHRENMISLEWELIKFYVFDFVPLTEVFATGQINLTNFKKQIKHEEVKLFLLEHEVDFDYVPVSGTPFFVTWFLIKKFLDDYQPNISVSQVIIPIEHEAIPYPKNKAREFLEARLDAIISDGGEGVVIRKPESFWKPERSHDMLKVKRVQDSEGVCVGFISGKEGKLQGLMGAMILELDNGVRLELSGFTDEERRLCSDEGYQFEEVLAEAWATTNPGQECPDWILCTHFRRGDRISFRYRELSKDGVPVEARYWRKRNGS